MVLAALAVPVPPTRAADEPVADPVAVPDPPAIEFRRVHVPADRLSEVPLGPGRYVPMSAREFEEGITRLMPQPRGGGPRTFAPALTRVADVARYDVELSPDGVVSGTVSFDIGSSVAEAVAGSLPREVSLGDLDVRAATTRTSVGVGEGVIFGRPDGGVAIATPEPGTYTCTFRHPAASTADPHRHVRLPLVPALSSTVLLRLPRGVRPVVAGGLGGWTAVPAADDRADAPTTEDGAAASTTWRIDTGPREAIDLLLVPLDAAEQRLSSWTSVSIRGREARITLCVRPSSPWLPTPVRLRKDAEVILTGVVVGEAVTGGDVDEASWRGGDADGDILVDLPTRGLGGREPLVVTAVAPLGQPGGRLPLVRIDDAAWSGGGIDIGVTASLAIASVELENAMVVPPEAAARWPLAASRGPPNPAGARREAAAEGDGDAVAEDGVLPARIFVEEQSPRVAVMLSLAPRSAALDVARVTAVDLSPGVVVGRAACDVRVLRGEAFDLTARVTAGWFIDSVEAVSAPSSGDPGEAARRRDAAETGGGLDWRVQRDARGDVLRIGLTAAATPTRGLVLRITGHRGGTALGEGFPTTTLDMVHFEGESERSALVEVRTSPDMTVEFDGGDQPAVAVEGRFVALAEEGPVRGRTWGGHRAASRTARLVRRRPPLDVRTQVRLTVRDDRLTEAFTFECQPSGADLDAFVVQFSEAMDVPLAWSLLPPATGAVSARRLDATDPRPGQGGAAAGGERWLVELVPAARGPVAIRGARTVPFTRATAVPMAWVENATSAIGQVIVRDVGRSRPRLVNRGLVEVAPDPAAVAGGGATLGEFSYGPDAAARDGDEPAAEILPAVDARAWAWREITSSWCHASGATEYETRIDIENQGRAAVSLSLPPGRRVQGILVDGGRVSLGDRPAAGGDLRIELPTGRQFVSLVVRSVADSAGEVGMLGGLIDAVGGGMWNRGPACWRVEPPAVGIDVPVLQREWRLALPPDLDVAVLGGGTRMVDDRRSSRDWAARLLAARVRTTAVEAAGVADGSPLQGFRGFLLVPSGSGGADAGVVVIRSQLLGVLAVLAGMAAGCAVLLAGRIGAWPILLTCLLAGVAALWCAAPFDGVARAAWWAAVGVAVLTRVSGTVARRAGDRPTSAAAAVVGCVLAISFCRPIAVSAQEPDGREVEPAAAVPAPRSDPLRVFITTTEPRGRQSGQEPLALVPEELFRAIVRGEEVAAVAPVRVLSARLAARAASDGDGGWGVWRLTLDVDADENATMVLDQAAAGGRFPTPRVRIDGVETACRLDAGGGLLRVAVPGAGRHVVELDVEPGVQRRGETEAATIAIASSPAATLQVTGGDTIGRHAILCERLAAHGTFVAAAAAGTDGAAVYDVSRSSQVRLVRSLAAGAGIATQPQAVVSRNDVSWSLDGCRVNAVFEIEPADAIVRSVVVLADPGLELVEPPEGTAGVAGAGDGVAIRPVGGGRFVVERRSPDRGRMRFEMSFRMGFDDPVGAFDVPAVWLEHAVSDTRTVRFSANPSLATRVDLPTGLAVASIPGGEPSFEVRSWREEVNQQPRSPQTVADEPQHASAASRPRPRLWVERRRQEVRGSQRLFLAFAEEAVRLHLDARIDASSMALVTIPLEVPAGCVIDRVGLVDDDALHPDAAERGPIDVHWSLTAERAATIVVQRPRAGRFRLDVDARIPGPPAASGTFPCLRVTLAGESRTSIEWRIEDGRAARLTFPAEAGGTAAAEAGHRAAGRFERPSTGTMPDYALEAASTDVVRRSDEEGDQPPPEPVAAVDGAPPRAGRVELADIRIAADERGKVWGLARFEMLAAERTVRLRLPPTWRLFDVSVDGRPVEGVVPQADSVWEFRLLDPGWPRSVVALFVGDLGRRLVDGTPFALPTPEIVGLPCTRVIWTVQVPEWIDLRVQEPALIVAADRLREERHAAMARLERDFEQAIALASGPAQERLRRFFEARRDGATPAVEPASFSTPAPWSAGFPHTEPVTIIGDAGRLTMRAVRRADATTGGRALATLSLLAGCGAVWFATRRGRPIWMPATWWPWLLAAAGALWILRLTPVWPGVAVLLTGVAIGATTAWDRARRATESARAIGTFSAGAVAASGEMTTRVVPGDRAL